MQGFQGVPIQVACSKLGTFAVFNDNFEKHNFVSGCDDRMEECEAKRRNEENFELRFSHSRFRLEINIIK